MSDAAAAAAATGVPEELIVRAAKARATANGTSVDAVLGAWTGGGSVATAAPAPSPEPVAEAPVEPTAPESSGPAPSEAPAPTTPEAPTIAAPVMVAAKVDRDAAPLLVGRVDRPIMVSAALVALFVMSAFFAVAVPGLDARNVAADQVPGTTPILSAEGLAGRDVYLEQGCMYCHTQQVRTVVTDIGLGPVTEPGTSPAVGPPTLGFVRIGPDLTHIGSRYEDLSILQTVLLDPKSLNPDSLMPSYAYLSEADLAALVQFLEDSK